MILVAMIITAILPLQPAVTVKSPPRALNGHLAVACDRESLRSGNIRRLTVSDVANGESINARSAVNRRRPTVFLPPVDEVSL